MTTPTRQLDTFVDAIHKRASTATGFAKDFLLEHSGNGNDINGSSKSFTKSGLTKVFLQAVQLEHTRTLPLS